MGLECHASFKCYLFQLAFLKYVLKPKNRPLGYSILCLRFEGYAKASKTHCRISNPNLRETIVPRVIMFLLRCFRLFRGTLNTHRRLGRLEQHFVGYLYDRMPIAGLLLPNVRCPLPLCQLSRFALGIRTGMLYLLTSNARVGSFIPDRRAILTPSQDRWRDGA
jgi:hypothetical protein